MAADGRTFDNRAAPYTANGNYAKIPICHEGSAPSGGAIGPVINKRLGALGTPSSIGELGLLFKALISRAFLQN